MVGFVDVPGHVRFIKNMLAGVGAVEVAMLVVAANEGWMPQTEEHLRILELLGVDHGIVVLTKADLVDEETLELAQLELDDRLAGRAIGRWPVVVADALSGRGVDAVRAALAAILAVAPVAADRGRPRLWVDRSFAARGAGTIVTGTLGGGTLRVDDEVVIEPGARRGRVRGLESHHERLERVGPGCARRGQPEPASSTPRSTRGDAVVRADQWERVAVFDAALTMVPGEAPLRRGVLQAHVGSGVHPARVRPLGDGRFARVRLTGPALPLAPGDRLVLRSSARRTTVAGAVVLDVDTDAPGGRCARPPRAAPRRTHPRGAPVDARRRHRRPSRAPIRPARVALLDDLVGPGRAQVVGGWTVATEHDRRRSASRRHASTAAHHERHPIEHGIDLAGLASTTRPGRASPARAALADDAALVVDRDTVRLREHGSARHRRSDRAPLSRRARRGAVLAPVARRARRRARCRARPAPRRRDRVARRLLLLRGRARRGACTRQPARWSRAEP